MGSDSMTESLQNLLW